MSECEHAARVSAYHDGELSAAAADEVQRHLRGCPECAAELERLRALSGLLASASRPAMDRSAMARLHRRVDLLPRAGLWRMAEALAAVAAVILLACTVALVSLPVAPAAGSVPVWEMAAVPAPSAELTASSTEEQLAMWMIEDLSGRDGND